ncbi:putative redox protein [Lewinella marina]|uniref:Osmotically inducible protein C n=1 Tax=Neolewinella marina TaxID=438751 RepID=A0A2G0CDL4_9BACT|nr:bifunctional alpha/beta hydrolase/OsmC family protein [Neolewinella marina]NJB85967.1 putative redox protein [Neolewinella marina]PHK98063.1 osmotically inducible protein C [Neolewinella marina]
MSAQKVSFSNAAGQQLSARLELPVNRHPYAFALFAHCFTCGQTLTAIHDISRELNLQGIGVLRFDFTGIGESEGDFVDTTFATNISDLEAAAAWLAEHHTAPALLVGHSLGGAAALCAAARIESVRAVATIGSPFAPDHVSRHFAEQLDDIRAEGHATVDVGGRPFRISRQFVEDLGEHRLEETIAELDAALLFLHSPQDRTVSIDEAAKLYRAARHPKSFVSLDGADHLLSDPADSHYAGQVIAGWSKRYLPVPAEAPLRSDHNVAVRLGAEGYTTEIMVRQHQLTADEPEKVGGNDFGPGPYELVSAGLGACTAMTIQMYARRKKWVVEEVEVHLNHKKDYATDLVESDTKPTKIDHFERVISLKGNLTDEQKARLLEIADRCPVHRTLHETVEITTVLQKEE